MDLKHPVFSHVGGAIHLLVTDSLQSPLLPNVTLHQSSLIEFIETLSLKYQVQHLHCEGGGQLIQALAKLDVIDEFHLTLAGHTLFGGYNANTSTGIPSEFLPKSAHYKLSYFEPRHELGECFLSYTRR